MEKISFHIVAGINRMYPPQHNTIDIFDVRSCPYVKVVFLEVPINTNKCLQNCLKVFCE
jgi:hypothetical protein